MKNKTFRFLFIFSIVLLGTYAFGKLIFTKKVSDKTILNQASTKINLTNTSKKLSLVQTTSTILVSADAYLDGPNKGTNYGASTGITVKQTSASSDSYNRIGVLKFDLSGIDESKGRITKAELKVFLKSTDAMSNSTKHQNFDDTPYLVYYSKVDNWTESGVNWNNYAAFIQAGTEADRVLGKNIPHTETSPYAITANTPVVWDVTQVLRKDYFNDNSKTLSLGISSTPVSANMGGYFHSKENGNSAYIPCLVITQDSEVAFTQPEDTAPTVFSKILDNISTILYDEAGDWSSLSSTAQGYLSSIQNDGSWTDLTYTGDVPTAHLDRLKKMALAYTNSQSSLYNDGTLFTAIVNGLQKWYAANPNHSNWFYDQIAYPQRMGQILVLMRNGAQKTPADLELNILARMKSQGGAPDQSGSQGTGANKINIAMHWIYRGCLVEDNAVLSKGVSQAFLPMQFTTDEGLQYDYSYLQHGKQVYIGGYGWDIVNAVSGIALYTVGTEYTMASADLDYLSGFLRQAYLRVIRGQNFMFNAFGRGIARENGVNQAGFGSLLQRMKVIDPVNTTEYDQAIARLNNSQPASYGVQAQHTHFYSSDYTLLTKPEYTIEVRGVSSRTLRNENGNGENLKGYFLSDGATAIAITGTEYKNIFPTWDWSMIPGVTARQGTMVNPAQWGTAGNTDFVGGVSDTLRGISVYDLDNNSTKAKKAYFFFDDEMVCLGAGVTVTAGTQEAVTTLNQVLLQSDVITENTSGVVNTYAGNTTSLDFNGDLKWAMQGGVGYVLPQGGNIGLTAQNQSGSWSLITTGASSATVNKDVFKLWYKHGLSPSNDTYAYIVVPNKNTTSEMQSYVAKQDIDILQNTTDIQAVRHKTSNLHSFVFLKDNQTYTNDSISVNTDKACLLMIQPMADGKIKINVADPTKTLTTVKVTVQWTNDTAPAIANINLPSGNYLGKSAVSTISRYSVLPINIISFTGKSTNNGVQLNWTSSQEKNTDYIEIWRNELNQPKVFIGRVNTKNSDGTNHYNWIDGKAPNAVLYYQLKVVDKDGKSTISNTIAVNNQLNAVLNAYPNPANSYLNVQTAKKELVKLYNNLGMLVLQSEIDRQGQLNVSQLPNGIYYLKTSNYTQKINIQH